MALHIRVNCPPFADAIEALAEGLVLLNVVLMSKAEEHGHEVPRLYESKATYRRERPGQEFWKGALDALGVAETLSGDCEDLASYRAAELRYMDDEQARVVILRTERGTFHAVVERADGTIEDPSRICVELEARRGGKRSKVR